jgi:hypothetical protein
MDIVQVFMLCKLAAGVFILGLSLYTGWGQEY